MRMRTAPYPQTLVKHSHPLIYICILHTDELRYQLSEAEKNFAKRWRPPENAKWGEEGAKVVTVMQDCTESLHIRPVPVNLRRASTKW